MVLFFFTFRKPYIFMLLKCNLNVSQVYLMKRIMVNFTNQQAEILNDFRGIFGNSYSEIVKYIVVSWLNEKGYIKKRMDEE